VRGVYSASFLKLMVCMVSLLVYVMLNRATIHKPTVFVLFGIYAVYTIAETILLSRIVKA
jgi:Ca2+/Na+ antiporter